MAAFLPNKLGEKDMRFIAMTMMAAVCAFGVYAQEANNEESNNDNGTVAETEVSVEVESEKADA